MTNSSVETYFRYHNTYRQQQITFCICQDKDNIESYDLDLFRPHTFKEGVLNRNRQGSVQGILAKKRFFGTPCTITEKNGTLSMSRNQFRKQPA